LESLSRLEYLHMDGTQITDDGIGHLRGLLSLRNLSLNNTRVHRGLPGSPAQIAEPEYDLPRQHSDIRCDFCEKRREFWSLQILSLSGTKVTDAGLANAGKLAGLTRSLSRRHSSDWTPE